MANYFDLNLPTGGILYDGIENPQIRPLIGSDEELLSSTSINNIETSIKKLIKATTTGIPDVGKVTLGDQLFALIWLAIQSIGKDYPVTLYCDHCYQKVDCDIDLSTITVDILDGSIVENNEVELSDGKKVKLKLFTVDDEINIARYEKEHPDKAWSYRWACTIVDKSNDIFAKMKLFDEMPVCDTNTIKAFQVKYKHGPDLKSGKYTCPKCGGEGNVSVPFQLDYLFPTDEQLRRYIRA